MKRIKLLALFVLSLIIMPGVVSAASGTIKITGSSTAIKGNTVTYTVTMSSSTSIGSWQVDLDYDHNYLKLTSSTAEDGSTYMVNSSNGIKSKSYTFTFKTLKTGNTTVKISSYYVVAYDESTINMSVTNKTTRIMTQEELEATYSSDATLKSLSVEGYDIDFSKDKYEYSVEVENDVTKAKISATKNDSNASVSGTGEFDLEEGDNKFNITVTAQKGNEQVYTVNVIRKELSPIEIEYNGIKYRMVRKESEIVNYKNFTSTTITYDDIEVPALYSEITDITLVGLKDNDSNVKMYIYKDGIVDAYTEFTSNQGNIIPQKLVEDVKFERYVRRNIKIKNIEYEVYSIKEDSNIVVLYGLDTITGENNYYEYDIEKETFMVYDDSVNKFYEEQIMYYKYILLGAFGLIVILLLICIFKKGKTPKKKEIEKVEVEAVTKEEIKLISEEEKETPKSDLDVKIKKEQDKLSKSETKRKNTKTKKTTKK